MQARAGSLRHSIQLGQALALLGSLGLEWPGGPSGMGVSGVLGGLRVLLQDPALSHFACGGASAPHPTTVWLLFELAPLLEALLLLGLQVIDERIE